LIVLDTTILVCAKSTAHPLRDACRRLIDTIGRGGIRATTTTEVIQEFAHIRARRRSRDDAARLSLAYAELLAPLLVVRDDHLRLGLRLFERRAELGAIDASWRPLLSMQEQQPL
jgi:predicted nucleic acid-binding protein